MREYVIESTVVADCITAAAEAPSLCCDVTGPCADVTGTGSDVITGCVCTMAEVCCRTAPDEFCRPVQHHLLLMTSAATFVFLLTDLLLSSYSRSGQVPKADSLGLTLPDFLHVRCPSCNPTITNNAKALKE